MLSALVVSPTGEIRKRCSNTQSLPPRSWHSVRLISGPVSRCRSTSAEYSLALSRAGAGATSDISTSSAILWMNASSGKLAIVPPLSKLGSGARQQALDRLLSLARLERHFARRSLLPIPPYQRETVLLGETHHHTPRVLSQLFFLQQPVEVSGRGWRHKVLIIVRDGFWRAEALAVVVFYFMAGDSHDPGPQ